MQASGPCAPDLYLLKPKLMSFDRHNIEDYYCAKFQVALITGFHFIMLKCTRIHTRGDQVITISTPPYYGVSADKNALIYHCEICCVY